MIEGKLSNQSTKQNMSGKALCGKCSRMIPRPSVTYLSVDGSSYSIYSYLGTDRYLYESKSGQSIVYCSKYCRNKHNHRFTMT